MRVYNYMIITIGLAFLLTISGVDIAFGSVLSNLGISFNDDNTIVSQDISNSLLYLAIFGGAGILIGLVTGVIIGAITRSPSENYVILPFIVGTLTIYIGIWMSIINYSIALNSWVTYVILAICLPLSVGYLISLIEFFRGTD